MITGDLQGLTLNSRNRHGRYYRRVPTSKEDNYGEGEENFM